MAPLTLTDLVSLWSCVQPLLYFCFSPRNATWSGTFFGREVSNAGTRKVKLGSAILAVLSILELAGGR